MSETVLQGGRYRLLRRHGAGGLGDVWIASDERLHRNVAIKVLRRSSPELLARFQREALATASLQHPSIVRVLDYFVEAEVPYLVMELLEGTSLSELVHSAGAIAPRRAAALLVQVTSALDFAHAHGIIHRDVKPANIQVVPAPHGESAKVLDFGIAKLSGKTAVTNEGVVLGTPAFMAPEQTTGSVADARSDVFAAGMTLYFALAARVPYPGTTPQEILAQVTAGIREPLWRVRPDIDAGLQQIVDRATRHDPAERFGSAAELRDALQSWLFGSAEAMPVSQRSVPPPVASRAPQAKRLFATAAGLLVLLGALVAFGVTAALGVWLYQEGLLGSSTPTATPTLPAAPGTQPTPTAVPNGEHDDTNDPLGASTSKPRSTTAPTPSVPPPANVADAAALDATSVEPPDAGSASPTPSGLPPNPGQTADVTGRVLANGRGLARARVTASGKGGSRMALTSSFGYFRFTGLAHGQYTLTTQAKRHTFSPVALNLSGDVTGIQIFAH